jgi:hypothetical protein
MHSRFNDAPDLERHFVERHTQDLWYGEVPVGDTHEKTRDSHVSKECDTYLSFDCSLQRVKRWNECPGLTRPALSTEGRRYGEHAAPASAGGKGHVPSTTLPFVGSRDPDLDQSRHLRSGVIPAASGDMVRCEVDACFQHRTEVHLLPPLFHPSAVNDEHNVVNGDGRLCARTGRC